MVTKITVVNMIPQSQSNESNDDSETNIAVDPANPRIIGATAFTATPTAVIFLSSDGGETWAEAGIVPASTNDYNAKFSRNALYCGDLVGAPLAVFGTTNAFSGAPMVQIDTEPNIDQPWMAVETVRKGPDAGKDRVYAAYTNWNFVTSVATIDVCQDGTALAPVFNSVQLQNRAVTRNAPSVRPAIHDDGTVYAAYFDWRAALVPPTWGSTISDVVVARDDNWGSGGFQDLVDSSDSHFGVRVATGFNANFNGSLGPDRFGSDLALAVDPRPKHSGRAWVAWCDMQGTSYTLHVRRSTDHGKTWSSELLTVSNAKNPGLAVSSDGRVGVLYQRLTGPGGAQRWEHHVQFTRNGVDWHDVLLANTAATNWTGDYNGLQAHGRDFYGTFATDNTPDLANFPHGVRYQRNVNFTTKQLLDLAGNPVIAPSIDPFFFKISWHEDEEEGEERGFGGFERLEIDGLKYEKVSIRKLRLERVAEEDKGDEHLGGKTRGMSRLLWRIIDSIEREEEEDEDE
ncbi:sialidase family protein [Paraburkholderia sp. GAS334]|uniref:sialidase family protein n=1 Tax=Paraburkholderia sp. GAS334 TaxID=3035131 RepID=UPI003D1B73F0